MTQVRLTKSVREKHSYKFLKIGGKIVYCPRKFLKTVVQNRKHFVRILKKRGETRIIRNTNFFDTNFLPLKTPPP